VINVTGSFPQSGQGNLVIAVGCLYQVAVAYTIPNQEASSVAKALMTNFFCHFEVQEELHSGHGRNFKSCLM
jgi:hypothetical protein